jgi:hypothetical protein
MASHMFLFFLNRLSLRYILYSNHTDIKVSNTENAGQQQKHAQTKRNEDNDKVMKTCNRRALRLFLPRSKHSKAPRAKQHIQEGKHHRHGATARTKRS